MFDHFPKYHMKILLGDFNAKVGRDNIFKPIIGQESLHQYSNDNGVRKVNFAISKNLVVKSTMFPHRNIHKYKKKKIIIIINETVHQILTNANKPEFQLRGRFWFDILHRPRDLQNVHMKIPKPRRL